MSAPQEVVRQLLGSRDLEADHVTALRVEGPHDVADGAVLARRVDALEDDQDRVVPVRPETFLEVRQALDAPRQLGQRGRLLVAEGLTRVVAGQVDVLTRADEQAFAEVRCCGSDHGSQDSGGYRSRGGLPEGGVRVGATRGRSRVGAARGWRAGGMESSGGSE